MSSKYMTKVPANAVLSVMLIASTGCTLSEPSLLTNFFSAAWYR